MTNFKDKLSHSCLVLCTYFGFCALLFGFFTNVYASNIDRLKVNFLKGDYEACINEGEKMLTEAYNSHEADELYYLLGVSYLKTGNPMRASDILEIILKEFKTSKFRFDASLGLGDAYFLEGDYGKAESQYCELLKNNPYLKLAALLDFKLAQVMLKQGKWQEARQYIDKLNRDYPLSLENRMAKNLSTDKTYFTVQVGSFSSQRNAQSLHNKLTENNFPAYTEEFFSEGKTVYRVRAGKLKTRPEAEELAKELTARGFPVRILP